MKISFIHDDLEEIYMQQPERFEVKRKVNLVCLLKKNLWELKQALRQCYLKFDNFRLEIGFAKCNANHCVCIYRGMKMVIF